MTEPSTPVDAPPAEPIEAAPAKPAPAKPAPAKPTDAKPVEAKPVEAKPVEAKPIEAKNTASTKKAKAQPTSTEDEPAAPERTPVQIQSDIDAAQRRLADQVDELSDRLAPQSLVQDAMDRVKQVFVEEDGTPKAKPIAIVAGTLTSLVVLRKIFHRG